MLSINGALVSFKQNDPPKSLLAYKHIYETWEAPLANWMTIVNESPNSH